VEGLPVSKGKRKQVDSDSSTPKDQGVTLKKSLLGVGCCANFNTRKRTNRLQYSVCASARSYPQGIALQKLISI